MHLSGAAPREWLARQGQEHSTSPSLIIRFLGRHGAIPMATHIFLSCMITDGTVSPNSQENWGRGVIRSMGLQRRKNQCHHGLILLLHRDSKPFVSKERGGCSPPRPLAHANCACNLLNFSVWRLNPGP